MGRRRQAREIAFKIIFQVDVGKLNADDVLKYYLSGKQGTGEAGQYAEEISRGVIAEQATIDKLLTAKAHNWELERLESVDRNLLRLATYELLRKPDIPKSVIINEAIEMAKKYSTDESSGFINGILDKIAKQLESGTQ